MESPSALEYFPKEIHKTVLGDPSRGCGSRHAASPLRSAKTDEELRALPDRTGLGRTRVMTVLAEEFGIHDG